MRNRRESCADKSQQASLRFLKTVSKHTEIKPLLDDLAAEIKDCTGCDSVAIRVLDEAGNIPYQAFNGFSTAFVELESPLSVKSDHCMCINVIKGTINPALPFYTKGGSFYMNGTTRFLATVPEEEKGKTRNICNREGYESVALVPFRSGGRILGLIHVADRRENMIPLKMVEQLENVAMQLGAVFQRARAEDALRKSEARYRHLFDYMLEGYAYCKMLYIEDVPQDFVYLHVNNAFESLTGLKNVTGKKVSDVIPGVQESNPELFQIYGRVALTSKPERFETYVESLGIWFSIAVYSTEKEYFVAVFDNITDRKLANEALKNRALQQEVVAGIGLKALKGGDSYQLMDEVVTLVAETLNVEYCKVLELLPESHTFLLRAGVGWKEGLVGHATVGAELDSQAGYTLLSGEPVVVEDLSTEARFSGPQLLVDHSVRSGISVVIQGKERPFGVLGAHTSRQKTFDKDDISFIQAVANILGNAVERKRTEEEIMNLAKFPEENPNPVLRILHDGTIAYANSASLPLMNLWGCRVGHKAPANILSIVTNVFDTNSSIESEFLSEDKILSLVFAPVKDSLYINVYGRDVTERRRAEGELVERTRQVALGAEVGAILVQRKDLSSILRLCTESIVKHLDAAFARIWTLNEKDNVLELQASAGMYTDIDGAHRRIPVSAKVKVGLIAYEKKPHLTNAVIGDPLVTDQEWAKRERMVAFAGHPLVVADRLVGVMAMFSKKPLNETSLTALASIADEIALGIERGRAEEQIHFLAFYDSLTGLPNRNLFKELLKNKVEHSKRYDRIFAVVFIDLDDFKRINDTLGHETGDQLLLAVSSRLLKIIRSSDYTARISGEEIDDVARMGGDEFIVLLDELADVKYAGRAADRILKGLSEPYDLRGSEVFITASIGISLYPDDGEDIDNLFKNADAAMNHAKSKGKNNYQFYLKSMNETAVELLTMENNLHKSLERDELLLYYQPKMDLTTRKIIGMEALIRWKRSDMEFIPPSKFIPLAEASGLIMPIGKFVLRTACLQNRIWQEAGLKAASVAVNLSSRQFDQKNLTEEIYEVLIDTGLSPEYLEIEITESTIMRHPEEAIRTLLKLKEKGIQIAIDDFGTGYSSLNYLRRLPLDCLKIDISFVRNVVTNPNDAVIVRTIIAMAHSLNLKVVAEGVETEQQLAFLQEHGCDVIQGYLLGPPLPSEEFLRFLTE